MFRAITPAKKSGYPKIAALVVIVNTGINKASKAEIAVARVVVIPNVRMVTNPIAADFCANFIALKKLVAVIVCIPGVDFLSKRCGGSCW
jgi:hypothetical protein